MPTLDSKTVMFRFQEQSPSKQDPFPIIIPFQKWVITKPHFMTWFCCFFVKYTLSETDIAPENWGLEDAFPIGKASL